MYCYLRDIPQIKPLYSINDITPTCRVFYEIGEYTEIEKDTFTQLGTLTLSGWDHSSWKPSSKFKEIMDVGNFIIKDTRLNNSEYIRHHNFMITEYQGEIISTVK